MIDYVEPIRYNEGKVDWTLLPWDEDMVKDIIFCLNVNVETDIFLDMLHKQVRHVLAIALLTLENKPSDIPYTTSNLPWDALEQVCRVFAFGASKYQRDNYKLAPGLPLDNYIQSMWRHLVEYLKGEEIDSESKLPALAHLSANCFMYLWTQKEYHNDSK